MLVLKYIFFYKVKRLYCYNPMKLCEWHNQIKRVGEIKHYSFVTNRKNIMTINGGGGLLQNIPCDLLTATV